MKQFVCGLRRGIPCVGLAILSACTGNMDQNEILPEVEPTTATNGCPSASVMLPIETVRQRYISGHDRYFDRFDYTPRKVVLDDETARFSAREYDFVYCRENSRWTVQPGTLGMDWVTELDAQSLGTFEPSTLNINGQAYNYRVLQVSDDPTVTSQAQSVVLELRLPGEETPQRHTIYTVTQTEQAIANDETIRPRPSKLGTPRITSALSYGDRLWWTIAFAQGEGNDGIATIVSYEPATDEMTLIQPEEIWSQPILSLAITGDPEQPILWMGLASGLLAYEPEAEDLTTGTIESYTRYNSPLIGTTPTQLAVDDDQLWVGTRNGVCRLDWQAPKQAESWDCWQFTAEATLPEGESVTVYPSLLGQTSEVELAADTTEKTIEVLWWMFTESGDPPKGRYEVRLDEGFVVNTDQGASPRLEPTHIEIAGKVPMFWPGYQWHWRGDRFVRPLDGELSVGHAGYGIGAESSSPGPVQDLSVIRGDLDLLDLSAEATQIKHYSGWVDDELLTPFPTVVERPYPEASQPDPLIEIDRQLRGRTAPN